MFTEINLNNLPALCLGASFLGSGGGGDTNELLFIVQAMLTQYGPIPLLSLDQLEDDDIVAAIELVGAPIPHDQRHNADQFNLSLVLEHAIRDLGRPISALMPVEIGGGNALTPLCVAGKANLPLIDGDLLGRAFPEISMISTNIFNIMPSRAYIADPEGGISHILKCSSYEDLEIKARAQAIKHRTTAAVLIPIILSGAQAKKVIIPNSFSKAISIGIQPTLQHLCKHIKGKVQGIGIIQERNYVIKNGFLTGTLVIKTEHDDFLTINVKNEYLSLAINGNNIIKAPDIISLLKTDTVEPLLSDQINLGERVICLSCRGPELWYSIKGLQLTNQTCSI